MFEPALKALRRGERWGMVPGKAEGLGCKEAWYMTELRYGE